MSWSCNMKFNSNCTFKESQILTEQNIEAASLKKQTTVSKQKREKANLTLNIWRLWVRKTKQLQFLTGQKKFFTVINKIFICSHRTYTKLKHPMTFFYFNAIQQYFMASTRLSLFKAKTWCLGAAWNPKISTNGFVMNCFKLALALILATSGVQWLIKGVQ